MPSTHGLVSIPHRYAKNSTLCWRTMQRTRVSIPHRYAKNLKCVFKSHYTTRFQFLIGTLKTQSVV